MISRKTQRLIERRWRAFCQAVIAAEAEHGAPLTACFGESQTICDKQRMEAHHCRQLGHSGGTPYDEGGAILIGLPMVDGFDQDGGGW